MSTTWESSYKTATSRRPGIDTSPVTEASQSTDTDTLTEWSKGDTNHPDWARSHYVADSSGIGSSIGPEMPLSTQDQALHIHDTEKLPAALLALSSGPRSTVPLLPMVGSAQEHDKSTSRSSRRPYSEGVTSALPVTVSSQEDHQAGQQWIPVKETCKECGKVLIDETTNTGKVHQRFKDQKSSPTPSRSYTPSVGPF